MAFEWSRKPSLSSRADIQRARNIATFKWPCVYIKKKILGELEFTDNQLNTMSDPDSLSLTSVENISSKNPGN